MNTLSYKTVSVSKEVAREQKEWVVIDANSKNNEALTEYRFPAAHYKLETMVTVKRCTVYVNGVETVGEERDTTYVLTGIEPIILENNHYDRKIVK